MSTSISVIRNKRRKPWEIPQEILNNSTLNAAIERYLPSNYNFELHKTIWRIRQIKSHCTGLQMPDGLKVFAPALANILEQCAWSIPLEEENDDDEMRKARSKTFSVVFLGTVTYGACCIDDIRAKQCECDLLVHYGHSCLVPLDTMSILYVFVDIQFDTQHLIDTICHNFAASQRLAIVSTVQFVTTLQAVKSELSKHFSYVIVPQSKPLSPGEVLGCTSPAIANVDSLIYVGDGRFHLESIMIANPSLPAYRYDPYSKKITREYYDHQAMRRMRHEAVEMASQANVFGIIMSTLGRQGAPKVVEAIAQRLSYLNKKYVIVAMDEIAPCKLSDSIPSHWKMAHSMEKVEAWIQVGCPRLSIDWGSHFQLPLLNPFEAAVGLGMTRWQFNVTHEEDYPMDFYANDSGGIWTPNHSANRPDLQKRAGGRKVMPIAIETNPSDASRAECVCQKQC